MDAGSSVHRFIVPVRSLCTRALCTDVGHPKRGLPLASVLSEDNQALLQAIRDNNPESIAELEKITGRAASNLTRTLHTLELYGLVELQAAPVRGKGGRAPVRPVVLAVGVDFQLSF